MKRLVFIVLILLSIISCKENKDKKSEFDNSSNLELEKQELVTPVILPDISKWQTEGVIFEDIEEYYSTGETVKKIKNKGKLSYIAVNNLKVNSPGEIYRVKIIVKGHNPKSMFALRIQEIYPNRLDAVYNLDKEKVKKIEKIGDFVDKELASIKPIENGWYECTLQAEVHSNYVRVLFGVTEALKGVRNWEANDDSKGEILIVPASLSVEEVSF